MMNVEKQQLIDDFASDVARLLVQWEAFKDIDMERRSTLGYAQANGKKPIQWNLWWQKDLQHAWDTIGAHWKDPATSRAVHRASDLLCSNAAFAKLGSSWSVPLRCVGRDALLISSAIVAFGELQHPVCQHAAARWALWKDNTFVLGDHKNAFLTIPFLDKGKRGALCAKARA